MGNIVGEGFNPQIKAQVEARQRVYGAANRTDDQLRYMNANSAWVKMSSAVDIGSQRAGQIGTPSLSGAALAQSYVLFGGTATDSGNTLRAGLESGYTVGGFSQGYRPQPGIISMESKNRNRGSVRETTIQIKCFNTEQFQIIDALYLRLGFTVLVEWGHSTYIKNDGSVHEMTSSDTLTSSFLRGGYNNDVEKLQKAIEDNKIAKRGNYDATYGKISNFSWSFESDGTYSISVTLMSLGDVIESLKINTQSSDQKEQTPEEKETAEEELNEAETDDDVLYYARNKNSISNLFYKAKTILNLQGTSLGDGYMSKLNDSDAVNLGFTSGDDCIKFTEYTNLDENRFYVRLGGFLDYLKNTKLIYNKDKKPLFNVDTDEDTNLIFTTPYVLSSDPRVCIVKALIATEGQDFNIFKDLPKDFKTEIGGNTVGKLMNVYVSMPYIVKIMDEVSDQGKVSYFGLVSKICEGINTALGNLNNITVSIDEADNNRVYLIDETQLPNKDVILQKQSKPIELTKFQIYGYKTGNASFILDFGIKTEISKDLSTTMAVGAQANAQAVGEDATAFSKWNEDMIDRIIPEKNSADPTEDKEAQDTKFTNIDKEFSNFLTQMQDYKFDESIDTFPDILTNYLQFQQQKESATTKTASTTIGFIPINLNLTMIGLSGTKIYQKFSVDPFFLPSNYGETIEFLTKGISQKVEGNKWTTTLESLSVPTQKVSAKASTRKFPYTAPPLNQTLPSSPVPSDPAASGANLKAAQNGLSGIAAGRCGTKFITFNFPPTVKPDDAVRKTALQKSYDATFSNGQYRSGRCARYTYNHAYNYSKAILGTGKLANGGSLSAGGNANQSGYFANLIKLGFSQTVIGKNISKEELRDLINNKLSYNLGDVLVYWANENPNDGSASQYGHTQMYIGINEIKEKTDAGKAPKGWTTDRFTNYGSTFVYGGSKYNCWNLLLFRAPYPGQETNVEDGSKESRKLYESYAKELQKVLNLQDLLYQNGTKPLLENYKGTFNDDEYGAAQQLRILFGYVSGPGLSYNNKFPYSKLIPDHQKLFTEQFRELIKSIVGGKNSYKFKYPSSNDPKSYGDAYLQLPSNF
jgi:hypothetical protein